MAAESIICTSPWPRASFVSIALPNIAVPTLFCKLVDAIAIDNPAISIGTPPCLHPSGNVIVSLSVNDYNVRFCGYFSP